MHSFVRHITGPDERIVMLARLHWIYMAEGILWMLAFIVLGLELDAQLWIHFGSSVPFAAQDMFGWQIGADTPVMLYLFGGCGIIIMAVHAIKMLATEIAVTSRRLIYKTGLIFVEVEEIDMVEIRAEHVHHGLLGRFLGYGRINLDSRFVGDIFLPAVKSPYRLIRAMHTARGHFRDPVGDGDMPVPPHNGKNGREEKKQDGQNGNEQK